jgi:hypothetical protein
VISLCARDIRPLILVSFVLRYLRLLIREGSGGFLVILLLM